MNFRRPFFDAPNDANIIRQADKLNIELWRYRDGSLSVAFTLQGSATLDPEGNSAGDSASNVDVAFLRQLLDRFERRDGRSRGDEVPN